MFGSGEAGDQTQGPEMEMSLVARARCGKQEIKLLRDDQLIVDGKLRAAQLHQRCETRRGLGNDGRIRGTCRAQKRLTPSRHMLRCAVLHSSVQSRFHDLGGSGG